MTVRCGWTAKAGVMVGALALAASAVVSAPPGTADAQSWPAAGVIDEPMAGSARFAPADLRRLNQAPAERVRLLLAGEVGDGDQIADLVRANGGTVSTSDDKAGFVIADVPAEDALGLQGAPVLTAIAVDRKVRMAAAEPADVDQQVNSGATAATARGELEPYVATGEIGAPQFIRDHPTWDGRGVTIANFDSGAMDWTAPGLQTTSTGDRKVTRIVDFRPGRARLVADRVVPVSDGRFEVDGDTYTLPTDLAVDQVRFGVYDNPTSDINLDGVVGNDRFGAAVSDTDEGFRVWVDTDRDLAFGDETMLADWNTTYRSASFGVDDPTTPDRVEVQPFALLQCQTQGLGPCAEPANTAGEAWAVEFANHHANMAAATAAGHDFGPNNEHFDGVAPGAEVWQINASGNTIESAISTLSTGILVAARDGADVLNLEFVNLGPAGPPADPVATLVDNVAEAYGTISVTANGNSGPGLQTFNGSPATARSAVAVGASLSGTSLERLFGRPGFRGQRPIFYSSHGPALDGHWSPDVVAPTASVVPDTPWDPFDPTHYAVNDHPSLGLAPRYGIGGGTSNAIPFVAGAMALLISAASAEDVPYTPHTLKRAVELGAVPLDRPYGPEEIGHGLVNVPRAWTWLKRLSREGNLDRDVDTVTVSDRFGTGQGIYQLNTRRDTEQVTLTTNDSQARTYRLSADQKWIHLDRDQINLPGADGDTPGTAQFEVTIDPAVRNQPGVHTGVVTVDDPTTLDSADHEMLVTIVTPYQFDDDNRLHFTGSGKIGVLAEEYKQFLVRVPAGIGSLQVESSRAAGDPAGVTTYIYPPKGDIWWRSPWPIFDPGPGQTATVPPALPSWNPARTNPQPGIWEIAVHAREMPLPAGGWWTPNIPDGPIVKRHAYDVTITLTPDGQ